MMSGRSDDQGGCDCDDDGDGKSILMIPTSTGESHRLWRLSLNVRRFIAICKKASIRRLTRVSSNRFRLGVDAKQTHSGDNDNGVLPSPSATAPLLQSEQLHGASSAMDSEKPSIDNGDPPVVSSASNFATDSKETGKGSSSMLEVPKFQLFIDSKKTCIGDGAPSPSTVPLLQSEQLDGPVMDTEGSSNDQGAPSPSTVPLLQSEQLDGPVMDSEGSSNDQGAPSMLAMPQSSSAGILESEFSRSQSYAEIKVDDEEDGEKERETFRKIVKQKDLNSLKTLGGFQNVATVFGSNLEAGKRRKDRKSMVPYKTIGAKDFPGYLLRACSSITIFLLVLSACFCLVFQIAEKSPKVGLHDAVPIVLAIFFLVTLHSVATFRRDKKRENETIKEKMVVIIDGRDESVPISGIVEGDLVCLAEGQNVPADGLLVSGDLEIDGLLDKNIDRNQNPFLFSGSEVVKGSGRMLVTSVSRNVVSLKQALLADRINKPNVYADTFGLCMSLIIPVGLFLRYLHRRHDFHNGGSQQIKGEITVRGVVNIFERMLFNKEGIISKLASFLALGVIGIQHGMPFVAALSLSHWNEKMISDEVDLQNVSACITMGAITVICIDISGGLISKEHSEMSQDEMELLRKMKEMVGVSIKLFSEDDDLSALKAKACKLGVLTPDSDDEAVESQAIRNLGDDETKRRVDQIKVLANCSHEDKLFMVECLKKCGHVVAFYGGSTARDAMILKVADVGICDKARSTKTARESSDIILTSNKGFISLIQIWKSGRRVYHNIQSFIQLQLTTVISGSVITSIATLALGESPITPIALMWVNLLTWILGGLMLSMEPQSQELCEAAGGRNDSVMTKVMWIHILTQTVYQASVLLGFLFVGQAIPGMNKKVRESVIFNSFTLCQVFNYLNAMELDKGKLLNGEVQYGWLLVGVGIATVFQVLVAEIWARLNLLQWAFCFVIAVLSWGLGFAIKLLSPFPINWSFSSIRESGRMPSCHDCYFILFSSLFFLFSVSYCFDSDAARAFD